MTSRERVRRTFQFRSTDRVPFDPIESAIACLLLSVSYYQGVPAVVASDTGFRHARKTGAPDFVNPALDSSVL